MKPKAKVIQAPLPSGLDTKERQYLHDSSHDRASRHGASVPQMHQRLEDLSRYVMNMKDDIASIIRAEIDIVLTTNVAALQDVVSNVDTRLHRMETLLLHSDLDTFEAIDNAIESCKQSSKEGNLYPYDEVESATAHRPAQKLESSDGSSELPCDDLSSKHKRCGHEDHCLCGYWASSEGCIVHVNLDKCDFVCPIDLADADRSDFESDEDDTSSNLQVKADGTFAFLSWQTASVTMDRVDWFKTDVGETTSWHRLSHRTEGRFEEMDLIEMVSVGDVVQVDQPLLSADTRLGVEIPVGTGGRVESVDEGGHLFINFPSLSGLACSSCWVLKERCSVFRVLRPSREKLQQALAGD
jgi:hypothetical protein